MKFPKETRRNFQRQDKENDGEIPIMIGKETHGKKCEGLANAISKNIMYTTSSTIILKQILELSQKFPKQLSIEFSKGFT